MSASASASASAGEASADDALSQSSAMSSSAAIKARVKKKSAFHVPSSIPAEVREQWSGVQDESLLFDEVLTSHAFLLTTTAHYQYLPLPLQSSSAAPLPPALLQALRDKVTEEEDEREDSKGDAADAAPAAASAAAGGPTAAFTGGGSASASAASSAAPSSSSSQRGAAASGAGNALTEAQQLLVESAPPPPDMPDAAALNASVSSASTSSDAFPTSSTAQGQPPSSSSSSAHLAALAQAVSSSPLVDQPRTLPSLAYLDLHARREHVLRHLLLLTASAQKKLIEHSVKDRKDDGKKRKAVPSSRSSTSASSSSGGASPMLRLTILSLFPIIQSLSKQDPGLLAHILSTLLSLLQSLPLLSLRQEASDCIGSFRALLQQMLGAQPQPPQQSAAAEASAAASRVNAGDALTALIGLALAEGKVRHILAAVVLMLRLSPVTAPLPTAAASVTETPPRLSIGPFLSQLAEYRAERHLPMLEPASFAFSFNHYSPSLSVNRFASESPTPSSPPPAPSSSASSLGMDAPFLGSIASDGTFLYVLNEYGLFSVGSGRGGSVQRHVYGQNRTFHSAVADHARQVAEEEKAKERKDAPSTDATATALAVRPKTAEVKERDKDKDSDSCRGGTLLFACGRLFFASPNVEVLRNLLSAAGAGGPSSLLSLPPSSALVVEVNPATLEVRGRVPISHPRGALPLYSSTTTDGAHIYALYREHKQKSKHAASASSSSSSSSSSASSASFPPSSSSSSSFSSSPLSTLFATPNSVDVYSVEQSQLTFVRTFPLEDSAASVVPASTSLPYDRNLYSSSNLSAVSPSTPFCCYCTGDKGHLVRMSVPNRSGGYGHVSRQEAFSMETGKLVTKLNVGVAAEGEAKGSAAAYDPVNDLVWQYQHSTLLVQAWKNLEQRPASAPAPTSDASPSPSLPPPFTSESDDDAEKGGVDDASSMSQLLPASAALTHQLARQCALVPPNSGLVSGADVLSYLTYSDGSSKAGGAELYMTWQALPLSIDLHGDTFRHLASIISIASTALFAPTAASLPAATLSAVLHVLSCALEVLKTNLDYLPSPYDEELLPSSAAYGSPSSSSPPSSSTVSGKPGKHRLSTLYLFSIDSDVLEQLCILLLSFLARRSPSISAGRGQQLVELSLGALMSGLPHFFPSPTTS